MYEKMQRDVYYVLTESLFECKYTRLVLKDARDVDNLRELGS